MTAYQPDLARLHMVQQQIRPWQVTHERVLGVLQTLPRENFVPARYQELAYADTDLPLGAGRRALTPRLIARLLQALDPQPQERALEVGAGTGYLTACLATLCTQVVSWEPLLTLRAQAHAHLCALNLTAVWCDADPLVEVVAGSQFEVISVAGTLTNFSAQATLEAQLAPGGRLFTVIGSAPPMVAWLTTRVGAQDYRRVALFETQLPAWLPVSGSFVF